MRTFRKKEIFKAMKFQTIKNTKFYSSEIKWFYSMAYCVVSVPSVNKPDQSVVAYCVVFSYNFRSVCYGLLCCIFLSGQITLLWFNVLFHSLQVLSQISLLWLTLAYYVVSSRQIISQISLLWLTVLFFPIRSDQSVMV